MADDLRGRLGSALDGVLDEARLNELVDEILALVKRVDADFSCKKCGQHQRHRVEVPDALAVAKALEVLANQSFGAPAQSVRHEHSGVVGLRAVEELSVDELVSELAAVRARRGLPPGPPGAA